MKSFLILTCASVAGLGLLSEQAAKVSTQLSRDVPQGSIELGVKALTGQLIDEQLRSLERELHVASRKSEEQAHPMPCPPPVAQMPVKAVERPPVAILEAWQDEQGTLFARKSDGLTYRLLASGDWIALPSVQPSTRGTLAPIPSVP